MLNITGMNRFYYIRNFTDMRCKYSRILSVIRHQLGREPQKGEVFIVMSKNRRLVRLFSFDRISFSLYEKRFAPDENGGSHTGNGAQQASVGTGIDTAQGS